LLIGRIAAIAASIVLLAVREKRWGRDRGWGFGWSCADALNDDRPGRSDGYGKKWLAPNDRWRIK
jgi:hypothetical protein